MGKREVFIIGSKGIPAQYGGFETFADNLVCYRKNKELQYHVACISDMMSDGQEFEYHTAHCFKVGVPDIGAAKAVLYDLKALSYTLDYIKKNRIKNAVVYILACRIGIFIWHYKKKMEKMGTVFFLNPDGHEWKRAKWNWMIKKYWKFSEAAMVKRADVVICDSKTIESYIKKVYKRFVPRTRYISYGSSIENSHLKNESEEVREWYYKYGVIPGKYYLMVGRFVPENNYEIIIREFMKTRSKKDLVIITNIEQSHFYKKIQSGTDFSKDGRIKFVGTIYNKELLKKIRENAFGYIHGHEVGGTNPSLLEALGSTSLNLLLDVDFNREVGGEAAVYWKKENGSLGKLIEKVDEMPIAERRKYEKLAKERIIQSYDWNDIIDQYEKLFLSYKM